MEVGSTELGEKEPKERHIDISIPYFKKFIASKSKYFKINV